MRIPMLMAAAVIGASLMTASAYAATSPFVNFGQTNIAQAQTCPAGEYWSPTQYYTHDNALRPAGCYR
jgi:hypothetical protein